MNLFHLIGGLDVTIHSVDDLLYDKIHEYKYDKYFFNRALAHFLKDFKKYFKLHIEECQHALYIIEHEKDFKELIDLEENYDFSERNNIDIDKLNEHRKNKQKELDELLQEYNILKNKKYKILDIITGKRKLDQDRINKLYNLTNNNGIIKRLYSEVEQLYNESMDYYNEVDYYAKIKAKINTLKARLTKPFKVFSDDEEYQDMYIDGEYYAKVALKRLIEQKEEYRNKLNKFRENWRIAESYYDNFSKIHY